MANEVLANKKPLAKSASEPVLPKKSKKLLSWQRPKKEEEVVEEPVYDANHPPPVAPVPPGPARRKCSKCGHMYLLKE